MSNAQAFAAAVLFGAIIFAAGILIFTFGLFPNLVVYLQHIHWITQDATANNALWWTFFFAWLLSAFSAAKISTKG